MFPVWFACGTCRGSFQKLNDFLEHKKQYHLNEFQNTKCIIFEERGILCNDLTGVFSLTASKTKDEYHQDQEGHFNPPNVKVENDNNFSRSNSESHRQCHTEEKAKFVKNNHDSNDYDFGDNVNDLIPLKNITATKLEFSSKTSLKSSYIPEKSIRKNNLDIENANNAAIKSNSTSANKSDFSQHKNCIQAHQHNPFVLVRRLTFQEIQNYCVSKNYSNSKDAVEADRSRRRRDELGTRSVSFNKPQSVISKTSKKVKNSFQCKLCLEQFKSNSKLTVHLSSCSANHPHRHRFCVQCNQKFYKKNNLVKHASRCHVTKAKYCNNSKTLKQCEHCPMSFLYESQLLRHTKTHVDGKTKRRRKFSKPFKCQDCGRSFYYKFNLAKNSTPPLSDTKFKCLTLNCKGKFKIESEVLELHPTIHRYEPKWKCSEIKCGKKFLTESHLKSHLHTHSDRRSFMCPKENCEKTFTSKNSLRNHIKSHTERRQFHCPNPKCKKSFTTQQRLRDHFIVHSDSRPFKCPEKDCVGRYKTKCNLMNHLKAHENQNFTVESKSYNEPESRSINASATVGAEQNTWEYSKADDSRNESSQSAQDATIKHDLVWFKCTKPNCAKKYKKYCELKLHLRTHSNLPLIKCPEEGCGKSCKFAGNLRQHMFKHSDIRPFKCPQLDCQKSFKNKMSLRQHLITHSDSRPFRCPQLDCQKTFKSKISLRKHAARHSDARPFKCAHVDCQKSFKYKISLRKHQITHSDTSSFKCPQENCQKRFKNERSLWKHRITHSDKQPYKCTTKNCTKIFKTRGNLNQHVKICSDSPSSRCGELGPFKCKKLKCGKEFPNKWNLKRHLLTTHSSKRPFHCPVSSCEYKCKEKGTMKQHLRIKSHT